MRLIYTLLVIFAFVGQFSVAQPIASYSFDDGTATDVTGHGHDGRVIGGAALVEGIVGGALHFDGIDDLVGIPFSQEFTTSTIGVSLWFKLDETPTADATLISKIKSSRGYTVWIDGAAGAVMFGVHDISGGLHVVTAPYPSMPGVWTHLLAAYDGTELRLYLHGELAASLVEPDLPIAQDSKIFVGGMNRSNYFKGMIDQVSIGEGPINDQLACSSALKVWDPVSSRCVDAFLDLTDDLGIGYPQYRHFGIAVVDANNDGWVDLYYPNGLTDPTNTPVPSGTCPEPGQVDPPPPENFNTFHLNNGDGTFSADVAPAAGVDDWWNAMRHVWGDYDNDGMRDLLSHNFVKSTLYRAVSLDPLMYEDVTAASGLEICITKGTGASWVDLNNDGLLDVYACEYDPNRNAAEHVNKMFLNNGDGTFADVSDVVGLLDDNPMGVAFADYDNDGDQDFFVTNSHAVPFGAPSRLYRNDGWDQQTGIPTFTDVAAEAGVDLVGPPGRGFSAAWGDYDNDGRLDLLYGRESDSELFHNDGPNGQGIWTFSPAAQQGGLNFDNLVFQDGNFGDLNNDGWLDVLMANAAGENRVFLNNQDGSWLEIATLVGMEQADYENQGVVPADVDNDGDVDVVWYAHDLGEPNTLYRNDTRGNNWIQFRLTGTESNRDAVGARIRLKSTLGPGEPPTSQIREVCAGTGFFTDMPRIQTFGLGKATRAKSVEITWPSGQVQRLGPFNANQRIDITEPGTRGFAQKGTISAGAVTENAVVHEMSLDQNYPNPFNPSTTIRYSVSNAGRVTIAVYNILGQIVSMLVDEHQEPGLKTVIWDGNNSQGSPVPSGVYLYRMDAGDYSRMEKMILMK
ncbi:MAG: FG-GAP-like repeat-containing protein [Ignavibacteria bacterium]|nr:FG-GAP-like repeat-containing protein [Ignavibacteria bacterium]